MLSYEGAVKLLDFGIAKALGDAPETTKSGTMKGKYAYMAPEQTEGDDVDNRSDIFACGIVLHEVLTGRRLFKGNNDVQTIERVRRCEVPPPSLQNPAVPPELDAIILKALQRNPANRWADAADMANALDDVVHASRFQPDHLAQLLYDLFPTTEGGRRRAVTIRVRRPASRTATASNSLRSPTVPPISRTASGRGGQPFDAGLEPSLKPKSTSKGVYLALALLLGGGAVGWKMYGHKLVGGGSHATFASDPNRRFFVYVKSDPEGANIYRADGPQADGRHADHAAGRSERRQLGPPPHREGRLRELRPDRRQRRSDLDLADADRRARSLPPRPTPARPPGSRPPRRPRPPPASPTIITRPRSRAAPNPATSRATATKRPPTRSSSARAIARACALVTRRPSAQRQGQRRPSIRRRAERPELARVRTCSKTASSLAAK